MRPSQLPRLQICGKFAFMYLLSLYQECSSLLYHPPFTCCALCSTLPPFSCLRFISVYSLCQHVFYNVEDLGKHDGRINDPSTYGMEESDWRKYEADAHPDCKFPQPHVGFARRKPAAGQNLIHSLSDRVSGLKSQYKICNQLTKVCFLNMKIYMLIR